MNESNTEEKHTNPHGTDLTSDANLDSDIFSAFRFIQKWIKEGAPLSVVLGSIVTLLYCVRIGHLPIDGLESIATLGGAVAIVAALFLVGFSLLLAVPLGVTHWGMSGSSREALSAWFLVAKPLDSGADKSPKSQTSLGRLFFLTGSVFAATWLSIFLSSDNCSSCDYWYFCNSFLWLLAALPAVLWYLFANWATETPGIDFAKRATGVVLWGVGNVYVLLPVILWANFSGLHLEAPVVGYWYVAAAGGVLWFFYSIHLALLLKAKQNEKKPWENTLQVGSLLMSIALLPLVFQTPFHDWLMTQASVRIPSSTLVLKPAACAALRASGVPVAPSQSSEKADTDTAGCLLPNAIVLLRIGERWKVSVSNQQDASLMPRVFTLFGADVASWLLEPEKTHPAKTSKTSCAK